MKKVFISGLIIIALGGTGFFLGWAGLKLPPGAYGVMRSKTHGVDPWVLREGEFRWIWYKLIPTNTSTIVFTLDPVDLPVRLAGTLPLGDTYASLAGLTADFSYELTGSLSFTLKPEILPSLAAEQGIGDQDALERFEKQLGEKITALALEGLNGRAEGGSFGGLAESAEFVRGLVLAAFPELERFSCDFQTARFPDFALYNSAKALYEAYIARQQELLHEDIAASAGRNLNFRIRFDELERYGELLTKYPILLDYLSLERSSPAAPRD
jgi:hypothetical protein